MQYTVHGRMPSKNLENQEDFASTNPIMIFEYPSSSYLNLEIQEGISNLALPPPPPPLPPPSTLPVKSEPNHEVLVIQNPGDNSQHLNIVDDTMTTTTTTMDVSICECCSLPILDKYILKVGDSRNDEHLFCE